VGDQIAINGGTDLPNGYKGTFAVTAINVANPFFPPNYASITPPDQRARRGFESSSVTASFPRRLTVTWIRARS